MKYEDACLAGLRYTVQHGVMDRGYHAASSVPILFDAFAERGRHISKKQKIVRPSARSGHACHGMG